MKTELEALIAKSRVISKDIERAREMGDLRENAEYDAAKNAQAMNEKKISELQDTLGRAEIIDDSTIDASKLLLGATGTLKDLETEEELQYTLVDAAEADFNANKISVVSPIGKALLGHEVGDIVDIKVPVGTLRYKVLKIER